MVPINRMVPRSFITNLASAGRVSAGAPLELRGIAFGGDTGVKNVDVSLNTGKYSFRRWHLSITPSRGQQTVMVRCTNSDGKTQPTEANWNPSGFMRNAIEITNMDAN